MSEPIMVEGPKKSSWAGCLTAAAAAGAALLILAAIAIPHFFMKINRRAPQSEAKQNLGAIFTCQVSYFGETNTFASGPNCFSKIFWAPEGKTKYSYYCGEQEIRCVNCENDCPYPNLSAVSAEGFTVMAVGNVDKDDDCDVWTIDDAKNLKNVQNDH